MSEIKMNIEKEEAGDEQLQNLLNGDSKKSPVIEKVQIEILASAQNKEKPVPNTKKGWKKYAGIIFTVTSSIFFTLTSIVVKLLTHYHPFSISVWRFLGVLIPGIPIALYFDCVKKDNIFGTVYPFDSKERVRGFIILMFRGMLAGAMVITRFYALHYSTVADVTVISHTGPVFVTILAHFFLKEKCGVISILISIFTCFGVVVIVRPPFFTGNESFDTDMLIGAGLALFSTVMTSMVIILARKQRKMHFSLSLLASGIWGVAESFVFAESFGVMELPKGTFDVILTLLALPVLVFLAQVLIILALKFENAGPVSLIRTCDVIFAFVWQIIFLNVLPDVYSLVGAVIVIVGVVVTTLRAMLNTLPPEDSRRRRFRFLLW